METVICCVSYDGVHHMKMDDGSKREERIRAVKVDDGENSGHGRW